MQRIELKTFCDIFSRMMSETCSLPGLTRLAACNSTQTVLKVLALMRLTVKLIRACARLSTGPGRGTKRMRKMTRFEKSF